MGCSGAGRLLVFACSRSDRFYLASLLPKLKSDLDYPPCAVACMPGKQRKADSHSVGRSSQPAPFTTRVRQFNLAPHLVREYFVDRSRRGAQTGPRLFWRIGRPKNKAIAYAVVRYNYLIKRRLFKKWLVEAAANDGSKGASRNAGYTNTLVRRLWTSIAHHGYEKSFERP